MGRSYHLCQSVTGPLQNWDKREWKRVAKAYTKDDGTKPTGDELKAFFIEKLSKGWEVLPVGKCDNFHKKEGCRGHGSIEPESSDSDDD